MTRHTLWPSPADIPGLSTHQADTIAGPFQSSPLVILTGGPGTGKTHTVGATVSAIVAQHGRGQTAICAPTGKAAVRCTAAMQRHGLHVEATTIHRMLGVSRNGHDGNGWGFQYGPGCRLPYRFIVVDEASMLDVDTAAALFSAIAPGTHVLLVGDPYQLPPVGHGAPLRDLLAAGIPHGELTEIHRNEGGIVRACQLMREGRGYHPSRRIDLSGGENLAHIETDSAAASIKALERVLGTTPPKVDRKWDCQVICAVNEKSELSRANLNNVLQGILNPHGEQHGKCPFRIGDKVICRENESFALVEHGEADPDIREFVANGELGEVIAVDGKWVHVRMEVPVRTVQVEAFGGKFDLGFAITGHKSQGSEWHSAISMIDSYSGAAFVCSREWHYTVTSRSSVLGFSVGRAATVNRHCRRVSLRDRKTFLVEMLKEGKVA